MIRTIVRTAWHFQATYTHILTKTISHRFKRVNKMPKAGGGTEICKLTSQKHFTDKLYVEYSLLTFALFIQMLISVHHSRFFE